eukprot:GHVP01008308.1.p1 GENE.GHVP01008308.1~~GHVP01008308.1.p1  ORF type:complete len:117 (+),score=2.08 GHVP01008308.1:111-461(+)
MVSLVYIRLFVNRGVPFCLDKTCHEILLAKARRRERIFNQVHRKRSFHGLKPIVHHLAKKLDNIWSNVASKSIFGTASRPVLWSWSIQTERFILYIFFIFLYLLFRRDFRSRSFVG